MQIKHDHYLTHEENERIGRFLDLFADVEQILKKRLRLPLGKRSDVSELIQDYLAVNAYWDRHARELDHLRLIRNFLTHERNSENGYPVAVTPRCVHRLQEVRKSLDAAVPISRCHKKPVTTVTPRDNLAQVLRLAFEREFSQFPVIDSGRFNGMITENEITRWLGRHVQGRGTQVELISVEVRSVLRQKESDRRGIPIFRFMQLDAPEPEVMGLFIKYPALEVVLLTKTGKRDSEIEGLVTQWDAARYTPESG
jgi:CBS domain-containing protein